MKDPQKILQKKKLIFILEKELKMKRKIFCFQMEVVGGGRVPSQESIGTMSSRGSVSGSIYSVTSARSDAITNYKWNREPVSIYLSYLFFIL